MNRNETAGLARRFAACIAFAAAAAVAAPAFAGGGSTGDLEVGVFGGMIAPDDYAPLNPDGGPLYGFRIGYAITDAWSVEGSWQVASGLDGEYAGADTEVELQAIRFNFLYNFRSGKPVRWFVTGGVGEESVDADDVPMHEVGLGVNGGAGIRAFFGESKRFAIRATGRLVYTDPGGGVQDSQMNFEVTAGVGWSFGIGN